jgi:acetyltransferase-like isoleucine patch superfamily enzyme
MEVLKLFNRLTSFFSEFRLVNRYRNRIKYPGIGIAYGAKLELLGDFFYGRDCGIGVGTNIIIQKHATLKVGDDCYIGRYVEIGPGGYIEIGSHTSIQDRSIFLGDVSIGRYCTIAPNVYISSGRHYFDLQPSLLIKDQDVLAVRDKELSVAHTKSVVVEDDCWLGINVVVMSGIVIGKGVVVGANSVVTKDIAPYSVVAGAPAKVIKKRLNFAPPRNIIYDRPNDLPYFYSGFEVSQSSLDKYASYGGIAAQSEFVLCLDVSLGTTIHILTKNIDSQICTLTYGDQRRQLSDQFQEEVFKINDFSRKTHRFCMQTDSSNALLIIEKAWIQ